MAISAQAFPHRKRRPSAAAFVSPKLSGINLLQSLLLLTKEISSLKPFEFLFRRNSLSVIRKSKLLAILFEELLRAPMAYYSTSAVLCFEEMFIVLQRIKALIEDCSNGSTSKMWLLVQNNSMANNFHELTLELSTLLDIFPLKEIELSEDVEELVCLVRKQCSETKAFLDPEDEILRLEIVTMLDRIKKEIVPDHSKLSEIFTNLGIRDSSSCREEIESLQEEVQNQNDDKSKSELVALIGIVRYTKCVLFGASTPQPDIIRRQSASEIPVPSDFRCPISLDLMRDPVVVATGQTYDRESIKLWIESGHNTCPKTGQTLAHTELIPNCALKNLIAMWCRDQKIPFETAENKDKPKGLALINKAALEATKMTASFLVNKLSQSQSFEDANGVVYELRALAKTDSESRICVAEAGAVPFLVRYLSPDIGSAQPNLQVNAVTAILNLSILEENKNRIMETEGALNGVVEVLRTGATWEAKGNAAATIFSLSSVHAHRKRLVRKTRVVKGLLELAKTGPESTKRDALAAILNLAGDRDGVFRLVEAGVVDVSVQAIDEGLTEEGVTIIEVVVKRGGLLAIAAAYSAIKKLGSVLRNGSERARESSAATLVTICRKGGAEMVAELVGVAGIERVIWEVMGTGSSRGRRKAATLLRILRRWAAGLDGDLTESYGVNNATNAAATTTTTTIVTSSTTVALTS
ncbi:U-box domain-containing protein 16 [Cannabis sativa]|uniref:U-box domain-containing protein 16 n=1 Tax=Cannabis sativa TaxID=3483 RepID=UPI0029C9C979|nr:U-box domain-containing protein 16 [Cannabis sativa]